MSAFISSAWIDDDRAEFRRWSFSAMLAVAVHAAVAMAALAWHVTNKPLELDAPSAAGALLMDLAPLPAAPSSERIQPQPESGHDRGAAPPERANNGAEPAGPQQSLVEPRANRLVAGAPLAPVPPDDAKGDATSTGAAASPAAATGHLEKGQIAASHAGRVDPGPLDTSITVLPTLHPHKAFGAFGRNRMILLRPSRHPGNVELSRHNPSALTNASGNHGFHGRSSLGHAPGAHIADRVNASIEREVLRRMERARNGGAVPGTNSLGTNSLGTNSLGMRNTPGGGSATNVHDNIKNSIGAAAANGNMGGPGSGVVNGTVRNAVGMTVPAHPGAHGINADERREGIAGLKAREGITGLKAAAAPGGTALPAPASPPGILNGRGMARPGTSLSVLGGAPKTVPGMLSGSDFHSKHGQ